MSDAPADRQRALARIKADGGVIYGCSRCRDIGWVLDGRNEVKCSRCESWSHDHRAEVRRENYRRFAFLPDLDERDLTPAQRERFAHYLHASGLSALTVLGWVEGDDYDPRKDPEFTKRAEKERLKREFLEGAALDGMDRRVA